MPIVTKNEIHKLAEAAATDLIKNEIPLNDSVTKLAKAKQLNGEQISRLCEATNNLTFNKIYKSFDKEAMDRMVDFDVADSKQILRNMCKEAEAEIRPPKVAHVTTDMYAPLPDERYYTRRGEEDTSNVKTASNFELRKLASPSREKDLRTAEKTREFLRHEKIGHVQEYRDKIKDLRWTFKRVYNDMPFERAEKLAAALWQDRAAPVLEDLRAEIGLPEVEYNYESLTKQAGIVDDSHPILQQVKEAVNLHDTLVKIDNALCRLEGLPAK